jgi:hypothetical protein
MLMATLRPAPASMVVLCAVVVVGAVFVVAAEGGGSEEAAASTGKAAMVPALFVFGDSLIDNGNNNNLASFAKANYYPYGIDFAAGPTGRFCNGYTIVDELGMFITSQTNHWRI